MAERSGKSLPRGLIALALIIAAVGAVIGFNMPGCNEESGRAGEVVRLSGKTFFLELAADNPTRMQGLGGRTFIEPDGGMLFAFPYPIQASFVMRDCSIPIDIIFLDASGRVVATHHMLPEEPRREGETDETYEGRLKRYPSRYAAQFAIELAGGTLESLTIREGDRIDLDLPRLKKVAQ